MENIDNKILKEITNYPIGEKTNDESTETQKAQKLLEFIKQQLTSNLKEDEFAFEVKVNENEDNPAKIDIIHHPTRTAYEIKYSGKNISHEFYKDVFKVIIYNRYRCIALQRFVFISERKYIDNFGGTQLCKDVIEFCEKLSIQVSLLGY